MIATGILLVCFGALAIDMEAYCFGSALIFFGALFIAATIF
jgi:hypothetical protein